jgi:hypothetical protein
MGYLELPGKKSMAFIDRKVRGTRRGRTATKTTARKVVMALA